jgi:hypothetical protein
MSKNKTTTSAVGATADVNSEESRFAETKANEIPVITPETVAPVATPEVVAPVVTPETVTPVVTPEVVAPIVTPETVTPVVTPEVVAPVVTPETVTPVVTPEVVAPVVTEIKTHEATIIPSGRFISENGNEYELTVGKFTFQGKVYTKEEALSDHPDVLEHLASLKSFILKKV